MWLNLFSTVCVIIQIWFTVKAVLRWFKEDPLSWYKQKLSEYTTDMTENHIPAMIEREVKVHRDRLNLLSKENAKLIEKNEHLREKLKNLGFSDISIDQ